VEGGSRVIFVEDLKTAKFTVTAEGKQSSSPAKEIVSGTEPGRGSLGTLYESFA
jgi:hypothetical protein